MKETDGSRRPEGPHRPGGPEKPGKPGKPDELEQSSNESLVERAALDAGFSLVGISGASPDTRSESVFEQWVARGKCGEMRYLRESAARRKDLSLVLDGATSVVCVAVDYYSLEKEKWNASAPRDGRGQVALYAHGRDYHDVVGGMLADVERRLRGLFPGVRTCRFVDTGPVPERTLALQAGIGWLGKNACVITPRYGSWIFLGELITNLALEPGAPLETLCGDCRRCIEACPTGALDEFVVDARKCISYLTIETKGEIPAQFHRAIGDRLFGCDECQRVCPFNDGARESAVFRAEERNPLVGMKVEELVGIPDDAFRALARGTAMRRPGPEGLRRNAGIVARNRL